MAKWERTMLLVATRAGPVGGHLIPLSVPTGQSCPWRVRLRSLALGTASLAAHRDTACWVDRLQAW